MIGLIEINDGQLPMKEFLNMKKNEFIKEDKQDVSENIIKLIIFFMM